MQGLLPLYRYFQFEGRSGRAEYWQWVGLNTVAGWLVSIADGLNSTPYSASYKFTLALYAATAIPWLAVGIRRLHDIGKSGWYYGFAWLLAAVGGAATLLGAAVRDRTGDDGYLGVGVLILIAFLVYAAYLFVLTVKPGDSAANAYGPPPSADPAIADATARMSKVATDLRSTVRSPTPSAGSATDPLIQIERLAKMRDAGVLTEEEFQNQKANYLSQLSD